MEALALTLTAAVFEELALQTGSPRAPRASASASDRERAVAGPITSPPAPPSRCCSRTWPSTWA
ncbi:hypothetical protein [Nannocystis pusilla]|uniref:hypothetical protein n=1 Tax=Nannocystis pusilla TaxID=889268 RepID=UPI003B7A6A50